MYRPFMMTKVRSKRITDAASGKPCTLRIASFIPGKTCDSDLTTVACHLPVIGKGKNTRVTDLAVAFGCITCHDLLDCRDLGYEVLAQRYGIPFMKRLLNGLVETQAMLVDEGIIQVENSELVYSR